MSVFQERPKIPPTQAQATAHSIPPEQYSYIASIRNLLRNKPFMLLVVTYGLSLLFSKFLLNYVVINLLERAKRH